MNWLNEICREILDAHRQSDKEAEALWASHLADLNPTFKDDVNRRAMVGVFFEFAAAVGFLVFVITLANYGG